jgi:UDP-N-acetyl-D-glucosamine dehydrogenase
LRTDADKKSEVVIVIGLGKIGLPLAIKIAQSEHRVIGVDTNKVIVDEINKSITPTGIYEPYLSDLLEKVTKTKKLVATTDLTWAMEFATVIILVVPLVVNDKMEPDYEILDSVTQIIGSKLRPGSLVIYETTLPISATRNRFLSLLLSNTFLTEKDFFLAYSPERVYVGDFFRTLSSVPKLVGGINSNSTRVASDFYNSFIQFEDKFFGSRKNGVWELESSEAAEFAKLAETTYRDVNVALANTFATHALELGLNINQIIEACNSQPFSHIHNPGIYVGGHCIPVYPHLYLLSNPQANLVQLARQINESMPAYLIDQLVQKHQLPSNPRITIMGVSYREGVKETYHSGIFKLYGLLKEIGLDVSVFDPKYSKSELSAIGLKPLDTSFSPNVLIFQNKEDYFKSISKLDFPDVEVILDGRGFIETEKWPNVVILGFGTSKYINAPMTNFKYE